MSFSIDGVVFDYHCTINRTSEMTASEISGLLLDKSYFNDVIGTFMRYEVTVAFPIIRNTGRAENSDYYTIYNILNDPVDAHTFVFPYNDSDVTVTARVESVHDVYVRLPREFEYWRGIQFEVIAIAPTKTYTLSEAITRGFAPLPDEGSAQIGDLYQYTADGWVLVTYTNADNVSY